MQSVNAADKPVDHHVIKFFEREASRPQWIPHPGAAGHTHGSGGRRLQAEVAAAAAYPCRVMSACAGTVPTPVTRRGASARGPGRRPGFGEG